MTTEKPTRCVDCSEDLPAHWGTGFKRCRYCLADAFAAASKQRWLAKIEYEDVRREILWHLEAGRREPIESDCGEVCISVERKPERVTPASIRILMRWSEFERASFCPFLTIRKKKAVSGSR